MGKKSFYEVDYITKAKIENGKKLFRVKWVGYPSSQNTWQPEEHLHENLIKAFYEEEAARQSRKQRGKRNRLLNDIEPDRSQLTILEMN